VKSKTPAWPNDVYQAGLDALTTGTTITGPLLPTSVWDEVERRHDEVVVMTILFDKLSTEGSRLTHATEPTSQGPRAWAAMFSSVEKNKWAQWIVGHRGVQHPDISDLGDDANCNTEWALQGPIVKYGENLSQRRLLTWIVTHQIATAAATDLLRMMQQTWWKHPEVEKVSLHRLSKPLDDAVRSLVERLDFSVADDLNQHVVFEFINPVKLLQLVSAFRSWPRTCTDCILSRHRSMPTVSAWL
jgi:hypothetical protein